MCLLADFTNDMLLILLPKLNTFITLPEQLFYIENVSQGLFRWREEDPSTRKIPESEPTFRLVYMPKFRSGWLPSGEGKEERLNCLPLAAERPAAAMFVLFLS